MTSTENAGIAAARRALAVVGARAGLPPSWRDLVACAGHHARCGQGALCVVCCLLLFLGASGASSASAAQSSSIVGSASAPDHEPMPLMAKSLLLKPLDRGRLTSGYGTRHHPFSKRRQIHRGIDWAAPRGTPVRAAGDGIVVAVGRHGSYGHYVRIDHGGTIETAYAHLHRYAPNLRPGAIVRQGEQLGVVGRTGRATGPHLHYEVLVAGRQVDPLPLAPATVAAGADQSTDAASVSEYGIGGPDIEADAEAVDAADGAGDSSAPSRAAIDGSTVISTDDLLQHYGR